MRHAFSFPRHIREAEREHVRRVVDGVDPHRFSQEPAYITALIARLEGVAYQGDDGRVEFRSTNINSLGHGAAERWSGVDFALTADMSNPNLSVRKAYWPRRNLELWDDLGRQERGRLVGQIREMRQFTRSPKVLTVREFDGRRLPEVSSGVRVADGLPVKPLGFPDYIVRGILTTLDGDTRPNFVDAVQSSDLRQLQIYGKVGTLA